MEEAADDCGEVGCEDGLLGLILQVMNLAWVFKWLRNI